MAYEAKAIKKVKKMDKNAPIEVHEEQEEVEPEPPTFLDAEDAAQRAPSFKGYDLNEMNLPIDARPILGHEYRGRHSYTVLCPRDTVSRHADQ